MTKAGREKRGERDRRRSRPGDNGQPEASTRAVGGRGLGKAGARRLGQMLKRVVQESHKGKMKRSDQLSTGPGHLLKQKVKINASETRTEAGVPRVPNLILEVISQCKQRGGMSMEELKQALAAGGYDVTKNNTKVNLAMRGLIRKESIVQTSGHGITGSFKMNKKKLTDKSVTRATVKRASKKPKPTDKVKKTLQRREAPAATRSPKATRKSVKLTNKGQSQERKNSTKARTSVTKTRYKALKK